MNNPVFKIKPFPKNKGYIINKDTGVLEDNPKIIKNNKDNEHELYSFKIKNKTSSLSYEVDKHKNIMQELKFNDEDEREITSNIIENMTKFASDRLNVNESINIPYIGVIGYSAYKKHFRENKKNIFNARQSLDKNEFKDYMDNMMNEVKSKVTKEKIYKKQCNEIRRNNTERYMELYNLYGKSLADIFVHTKTKLKQQEYNQELNDIILGKIVNE